MDNVYNFINDGIGEAIDYLNKSYQRGEIEGLVCGIKIKDDLFTIINSQTMTHLETVGLIECIKQTQFYTEY